MADTDGSVAISIDLDSSEAEKDLARLKSKIIKLQDEMSERNYTKSALEKQLEEAEKAYINLYNSSKGTLRTDEQVQAILAAEKEVERLKGELDRCNRSIQTGNIELDAAINRYGEISAQAQNAGENSEQAADGVERMSEATRHADGFMSKFSSRIAGLAKRVFVFSMITSALRALRTWVGNVIQKNEEAQASIAKLKAALLTLVQPLVSVVIPVFVQLVNLLTRLVTIMARVVSTLFGTTLQKSAQAAKGLNEEKEALDEVGESAKEAEKSLAGFDEINMLGSKDDATKSAKASEVSADENKSPDFDIIINSPLDTILEFFAGAALLALGAILTFSGANIPLGIALMAIGAAFICDAVNLNWQAISQAMQGPLGLIFGLVSGALLVIGAILAFSGGNIPLGIAMMVVGAAGLAGAVAINWNTISQKIQGTMGAVVGVVSAALLALGAVLAFSGVNLPLGIGLIAVGAVGLATTVAANWSTIQSALQGPIGAIAGLISGALMVIGAVLLFSGGNIPLGVGLLIAGAAGMAATVAANWDTITGLLQGSIGAIVAAVSVAILAIGAVLLFSGASIPIGLGLMVVGAAGLAASVAANWSTVQRYLQGPVGAIVGIISGAILVIGAVLLFSGANIPLGLGLVAVGTVGMASAVTANWGTIQSALQGPIGAIVGVISGALLVIGAILAFSGAALPLGIGLMVVGAAGLAASIAANWETIQESLGGPIATITAMISAAVLVLGVILLFTGAGIPLGLGLILAGGAGLAASIAPNWDFILDKLKGAWENIKEWWNSTVAKFTDPEWWKELGKSMIDGLLEGLKGIFSGLKDWASSVWDSIKGAFSGDKAKQSISGGIRSTAAISTARYAAIPPISNYKIPALAQGAVIPPNREFMAILGDQKRGNNLEGPESAFEDAAARGMQRAMGNMQINVNSTVEFRGSLAQLARVLQPYITSETSRLGPQLVSGGGLVR